MDCIPPEGHSGDARSSFPPLGLKAGGARTRNFPTVLHPRVVPWRSALARDVPSFPRHSAQFGLRTGVGCDGKGLRTPEVEQKVPGHFHFRMPSSGSDRRKQVAAWWSAVVGIHRSHGLNLGFL